MNVKVAYKVVFGFSIILLLLVFTSISSINILANIESATAEVDTLAIPMQQRSNAIQINLLKQGKLSTQITSAKTLAQLDIIEQSFKHLASQMLVQRNELITSLNQQSFNQQAKEISTHYQSFNDGFNEMLADKREVIELTKKLEQLMLDLNTHLDEAGALLVDLTYLEDSSNQKTIDLIAGSAGQIEGYLIGVTNSVQSVASINGLLELEETQAVTESSLSNIKQMVDYLVRVSADIDTDGVMELFVEEYQQANTLLVAEQSLFTIKHNQLEQMKKLELASVATESSVNTLVDVIDRLLNQVNNNVSELQQTVFDDVNQGQVTTIVIMIIVILLGSGIALATIREMILPLRRINKVLNYIAQGDLSRSLEVKSKDEYGVLSQNINSVLTHLKTLIADISQNSLSLNTVAGKSSQEIQTVSESLQQQKLTVEQMTGITDKLNRNADDVLSKSTHASEQMTQALSQSEELEQRAHATSNRIDGLSGMLDGTSGLIAVLNQEATNIGSILETIQSIADQTNLLALNAAIEAARAGEAGRGFAVVADEVRVLASRTQESIAEIHTMIESLQNQTQKVVVEIDSGKTEASHCQSETERLLDSLLLISKAIAQMNQMSDEIAMSATQQNSLSNDINVGIREVSEISDDSAKKSSSTLVYSSQVSEFADKLQRSVDEFKVK